MKPYIFLALTLTTILIFPLITSAHWIAGYVENALDATSPDGRTVRLWNPLNGQEAFGIVGPTGLSNTPNVYMIDCEMFTIPCKVGDKLNLTVVDDGSGYTAKNIVEVTVSGAGFDMAPNLTLNTPLYFLNLTIEDLMTSPENEIDLTPATTTYLTCSGVVEDPTGPPTISLVHAEFFSSSSSFGSTDDNNNHYTNSTCEVNNSYGTANQAMVNCTFDIEYYSQAGLWTCQVNATDSYSTTIIQTDTTQINTLLAIGADSPMEFGIIDATKVSPEKTTQVINYGNVPINLTLNGFGETPLDGNAMECGAEDIIIGYMKFNLTASNSSNLTLAESEIIYENLTSSPTTKEFNLNFRQDDITNDASAATYWRVYVPQGVSQSCSGNIVFGATQS
jgi:hypothetical protein